MRVNLTLAVACVLLIGSVVRADTGTLTYPAEDNLRLKEGSIEFWMKVPFDVTPRISEDKYASLLSIVRIEGESGGLNMHWYTGASYKGSGGLGCSQSSSKVKLHSFMPGKWLPKAGAWHHFALTWKDRIFRVYLDGELRTESECPEAIHVAYGAIGEKPIFFGDKWGKNGEMVLDEVRVSSVARAVKELGFHGKLTADPYTLILDDFEETFVPDGKKQTKPALIFAGEGGTPSKGCEFVEGKFGKGLALFMSKTPKQEGKAK